MSDVFGAGQAISGTMQAIGAMVDTMLTNDANNKVNRDNIAWQAKSMQASQNWQQYMRSTAYQATMDDMRKAGLNPILAADRGATGAGPVSIAPGSSVPMQKSNFAEAAARGISTATQAMAQRESARTQETSRQVNLAQATNLDSQSVRNAAETSYFNARTRSEGGVPAVQQATINQLIASARERLAQIPLLRAETGRQHQAGTARDQFGSGPLAESVEALTSLVNRLRGMMGNSARNPNGAAGSANPMGDQQ